MPEGTTHLDFETFMEVELRVGRLYRSAITKMQTNYSWSLLMMGAKMHVLFVRSERILFCRRNDG